MYSLNYKNMKSKLFILIIINLIFSLNLAFSQEKVTKLNPNVFFGGNLGLQFGTITFIDVSPIVGYRFTPRISAGVGLKYNYYSDSRYDYSTSVYGGNLFTRFAVSELLFATAEYEHLNMAQTVLVLNPSTGVYSPQNSPRYWVDSYLIGAGYRQPIGERASFNFMILYNLNETHKSPYKNPIIRIGFDI